jgi:hypothetical protein
MKRVIRVIPNTVAALIPVYVETLRRAARSDQEHAARIRYFSDALRSELAKQLSRRDVKRCRRTSLAVWSVADAPRLRRGPGRPSGINR